MQVNLFTSNFNKHKTIIGIISFIIILLGIIYIIGEKFEAVANTNEAFSDAKQRFDEFYSIEANSLDMVYIGSSHSYCTFDPEIIDQQLNTSSFQLGTPLQHPDSSYYVLQEVLKYQKPKVVVFEIYWDMLDESFDIKQSDLLFKAWKSKDLQNKYIKEVFPINEKAKYYIKALRYQQDVYAYYNNRLKAKLSKLGLNNTNMKKDDNKTIPKDVYRSKGYVVSHQVISKSEMEEDNQFNNYDAKNWTFDKNQKKYIDKIIELCNTNDIKLIFVTAPIANVSMEKIKNYDYINNQIIEFANNNEIPYIDYNMINKEQSLLKIEHFRDDAHLNQTGSELVGLHFALVVKKLKSVLL